MHRGINRRYINQNPSHFYKERKQRTTSSLVIYLSPDGDEAVEQTATLLLESFKVHSPNAWSGMDAAREEVSKLFEPGKISRVAVDENRTILGWIGDSPDIFMAKRIGQ